MVEVGFLIFVLVLFLIFWRGIKRLWREKVSKIKNYEWILLCFFFVILWVGNLVGFSWNGLFLFYTLSVGFFFVLWLFGRLVGGWLV